MPRVARNLKLLTGIAMLVVVASTGCNRGPKVVPVTGKVLFNGEPLEFGSVTFQPASGQPARGKIQSDGTFTLSSYREGDGAVVGTHKVRITCYSSQKDAGPRGPGEQSLGKLLIPRKYTLFDQSGLTATVKDDDSEEFVFELRSPKKSRRR